MQSLVLVIHKMCLLNLSSEHSDDDNRLIILPTEDVNQETLVRTEMCHESDKVTRTSPSHNPCTEERVYMNATCTSVRTDVNDSSTVCLIPRYGWGQGIKRFRLSEQDVGDAPSNSRLRTSENNGKS